MSRREEIVEDFEATMKTAILAAYQWVETGATREVPTDTQNFDDVSPENTPLVLIQEGPEEVIDSENGWSRLRVPIGCSGIIRRTEHVIGPMAKAANELLAVMQKTAWCYRNQTYDVAVTAGGPSPQNAGPALAVPGIEIFLDFMVEDSNP